MTDELTTTKKVTDVARKDFADEQRDLIRQTVAPDATQAEFDLFLEIAARHQLNPLTGEIYLAKMGGRDGGGGKFTMLVGRDGFLAIANRHPDFRGIESDVVHEFDTFKRTREGVIHEYEMGSGGAMPHDAPPESDAEPGTLVKPEIKKRGDIIGAWAIVHREGRVPTFFFAPFASYKKNGGPWAQYPDAMIRKVAIANALREAFNLSGLYHESEMDQVRAEGVAAEPPAPGFGDDELGERLEALVEQARTELPGKYLRARVMLVLAGKSDEERKAFADELEAELAAATENVIDADVVEEPA